MPGVFPRDMNGYSDFDHGPVRGSYPVNTNGYDAFRDDILRDDIMRRDDEDLYRRPMRNGRPGSDRFNADHLADQNSLSDFNSSEPAFELDHLATFAAGSSKKGTMHAEDGLRKLRQMENTTGIWTMRCILLVERRFIVILDKNSGEELERFPLQYITEPTAIFKNDRREIYNNLILFTVIDDSNRRDTQADMHIFQSVRVPSQTVVDEIIAAKTGHPRLSGGNIEIYSKVNRIKHVNHINEGGVRVHEVAKHSNAYKQLHVAAQHSYEHSNNRAHIYRPMQENNYLKKPSKHFDSKVVSTTTAVVEVHHIAEEQARRYKIPPPPTGPAPEPPGPFDFHDVRQSMDQRPFGYGASQFGGPGLIGGPPRNSMMARLPYQESKETEGTNNELLERDVQLLNHCFDDVEKFVARLQQAAEAYKELEKRKKERGGGKGKKKQSGDGMLAFRARPPPSQDFVDIFQKFKLSFNLLAKLKAHIHDPNAPELVHFLFTPLSLIYEASRDPIHGNVNLGEQAVSPVLTQEAKQLLLNCLTSKEIELWQALGKNWTTSRDEWKGPIPPYMPRFYDGWQPAPASASVIEETVPRPQPAVPFIPHQEPVYRREPQAYIPERVMPFPDEDRQDRFRRVDDFDSRFDPTPRVPTPPRNIGNHRDQMESPYDRNPRAPEVRRPEPVLPPVVNQPSRGTVDDNSAYLVELRRTGVAVWEVLHDRQGKNAKELTVNKGDYLQVLDNSRNWWKVRNYKGETGYCPYTILKEVSDGARDHRPNSYLDQQVGQSTRRDLINNQDARGARNVYPMYDSKEDQIIPLSVEDEEMDRHAFQPIRPDLYENRGIRGMPKDKTHAELQNELRSRMDVRRIHEPESTVPPPPPPPAVNYPKVSSRYIDTNSSEEEVAEWLQAKGFSHACRQKLQHLSGRDLLVMQRAEMEKLLGHEEAARLAGQITLQKKMTGYKTQSAAELQAIFKKRQAKAGQDGELGNPPDFHPQTPTSNDGQDSESDDDHLADTGKTLRDLLIRQRQKIIGTKIFEQ